MRYICKFVSFYIKDLSVFQLPEKRYNYLILIFYETPTEGKYKGFSKIFLDALKTFQGKICFVTPYSVDISLKQFSTNQPQSELIAEMLEWIK